MSWIQELQRSNKQIYSQSGEDGLIACILKHIEVPRKFCVEFGAYNGVTHSNTFRLRLDKGWDGLIIDGRDRPEFQRYARNGVLKALNDLGYKEDFINLINLFMITRVIRDITTFENRQLQLNEGWRRKIRKKYRKKHNRAMRSKHNANKLLGTGKRSAKHLVKHTDFHAPEEKILGILKLINPYIYWITAENILDIFKKHRVPKDFGVLSIDIDGNDYWVWKAIDENQFRARVVVIEFNPSIPSNESKTIPYDAKFISRGVGNNYYGASLFALKKLGQEKGYSLIHQNTPYNSFFVLEELLPHDMRDIPIEKIFSKPALHHKHRECPKDLPWVEV